MDKGAAIGVLVLGGVALWYVSTQSAQVAAPAGDSGTFDLSSLFAWMSPTTAAPDTTAPPVDTNAPAPAAQTMSGGFLDSFTNLFDFTRTASTSTSGAIDMSAPWKTGSYPQFAQLIANTESNNGIPTDLLARLLYQESHYRPDIIGCQTSSSAGAQGIAQFMPATAAQFDIDPCDPSQAIPAAGRYLAQLYSQFGSWQLALMAYNWGPGNVRDYVNSGYSNPVPSETQNYVAQITSDVVVT